MSASSTDKGLLTPDNCAIAFIDHQPPARLDVGNVERHHLLDSVLVLAKAPAIFSVPVILTAARSNGFSGTITRQLLAMFPDHTPIEHSSMNAWDCDAFVAAVRKTRRKNFLIASLWTEVSLVFPALQMLEEGYGVYAVEDASGGTCQTAHASAIRRIEQAGGVSVTALQVLLELQRDWGRHEHCAEVMTVIREHCDAHFQEPNMPRPSRADNPQPEVSLNQNLC